MMQKSRLEYSIFSAVCLAVSALFLTLSLLLSLKLQSTGEKAEQLAIQCKTISEENRLLSLRLEEKYSIEKLEEYASEILNMHRPDGSEIYRLEKIS